MKRRFLVGIAGVLIAVAIISAIWFYPSITNIFFSSTRQPNNGSETFQLSASFWTTPIEESRKVHLASGQQLVGNYTCSMLSPQGIAPDGVPYIAKFGDAMSMTTIDPQNRVLAQLNGATKTFSIIATSDGAYTIIFSCMMWLATDLPGTLSVTWSYNVNG